MGSRTVRNFIITALMSILILSCRGITVEGRIAVKGNEPHTYLAVETINYGELKIVGALTKEIRQKYQNNILKMEGNIVKDGIGPGFPPEFEATKIIEVK